MVDVQDAIADEEASGRAGLAGLTSVSAGYLSTALSSARRSVSAEDVAKYDELETALKVWQQCCRPEKLLVLSTSAVHIALCLDQNNHSHSLIVFVSTVAYRPDPWTVSCQSRRL